MRLLTALISAVVSSSSVDAISEQNDLRVEISLDSAFVSRRAVGLNYTDWNPAPADSKAHPSAI